MFKLVTFIFCLVSVLNLTTAKQGCMLPAPPKIIESLKTCKFVDYCNEICGGKFEIYIQETMQKLVGIPYLGKVLLIELMMEVLPTKLELFTAAIIHQAATRLSLLECSKGSIQFLSSLTARSHRFRNIASSAVDCLRICIVVYNKKRIKNKSLDL